MSTAASKWHHGVPSVSVTIDCLGERHRLTWRRGRLTAADHDESAERIVIALGGAKAPCLEILDLWRAKKEPYMLGVGVDLEIAESDEHRAFAERLGAPLHAISALPPAMRARCIAALATGIARFRDPGDLGEQQRRRATEILATRAISSSLVAWHRRATVRWSAVAPQVSVTDGAPFVRRSDRGPGGRIDAAVPMSWLVEVWGRDLAIVDGCFVLSADVTASRAEVLALRWERGAPRCVDPIVGRAALRRKGPGWSLRWLEAVPEV